MIAVTERSSQEMKYAKANGTKTRIQNPERGLDPSAEPFVCLSPEAPSPSDQGDRRTVSAPVQRIPSFSPRRRRSRLSARRRARVSSRLAIPTHTS